MSTKFIELTEPNGTKIFLNVFHIAWIEPEKESSSIKSNFVHYSLSKRVKESYDEIKALIGN